MTVTRNDDGTVTLTSPGSMETDPVAIYNHNVFVRDLGPPLSRTRSHPIDYWRWPGVTIEVRRTDYAMTVVPSDGSEPMTVWSAREAARLAEQYI